MSLSRILLVISAFAILVEGCKSSQVSKSDTSDKKDVTAKASSQESDSLSHKDLEHMVHVSGSIREDLEKYFEEYSQLDFNDETKRNEYLEKGLGYFNNAQTPVLIVVNEVNGKAVYDRPTTVEDYLDYLKHTRKNPHTIYNFELDEMGKIKKLELMLK